MLNTSFTVTATSTTRARIAWVASSAELASWIFVNGVLFVGGYAPGTIARFREIAFSSGAAADIEVHDCLAGEVPAACGIAPPVRPEITFNAVPGAKKYKVYASGLLIKAVRDTGSAQYRVKITADMQAGWHFVRVEALDEYGRESARQTWRHRVYGLPAVAALGAITLNFLPYLGNVLTYQGEIVTYGGEPVTFGE